MVYNVMGQKVHRLGGSRYEAGVYRLRMDARDLAGEDAHLSVICGWSMGTNA